MTNNMGDLQLDPILLKEIPFQILNKMYDFFFFFFANSGPCFSSSPSKIILKMNLFLKLQ